MENAARRPFNRSLTKEARPGVKKPWPAAPAAPDRSSSNQTSGQQQRELVNLYRTALAELTLNSKPIITNLTIIAGENAQAAKAIAATICANILEVPREQKLPSLYLLDSIGKNIGRDYIKHFATRLPEVFCKTYRQVDPSIHQGMRHLFGTWKGVFPPQTLQMIEKELVFTTAASGSSSGTTTSRPDSQAQRPASSIHVNLKYLEARQRLQTTRASGALVSSHEDVEAPRRNSALSSERSLADPYSKVRVENLTYGSGLSGFGTRRVSEELKEQELDIPSYELDDDTTRKLSKQKNGFDAKHRFESYIADRAANSESHLQFKKNLTNKTTNGMNRSWENSEEEEYMWDEIKSRPTDQDAAKDHWTPDSSERLRFDSHLPSPNIGTIVDDEASTDSLSTGMGQVPSASRFSTWSEETGPGKNISGSSGRYSIGLKSSSNKVSKTSFQSQPGPTCVGAPLKYSPNVMPGPKVSNPQQQQTLGAASSSVQSPLRHRPPSPSFSAYDPNQPLNNIVVRNQTSTGPPTDPRRPPGLRNKVPHGQFSQGSMALPSRNVYQSSEQSSGTQSLPSVYAETPPLQQRKDVLSTQKRKLDVSEFDSYGEGRNLMSSQISGSESSLTLANSSSDQFNPLTVDSSGQSLTSSLLSAVAKSGILGTAALLSSSAKTDFQEVGLCPSAGSVKPSVPSGPNPANLLTSLHVDGRILLLGSSNEKLEQPPLPTGASHSSLAGSRSEQIPSAVNSSANPVSSLLSTLVAKGLISASKSDSLFSASILKPDQPLDRDPGVASTRSTPISSDPLTVSKPHTTIKDEPSSSTPAAKPSDGLTLPATKIKNIIGFDFKPHIVRNMHPDVVSDLLSDLPHQCIRCGLRLQFLEQLDRHMEWHALKVPEQNPLNKTSRRWFANSEDWVSGVGFRPLDPLVESGEALENSEQMVTADESQCACIFCGELFEDFYCQPRNEWMYKGAIYLTIPSSESHERSKTMSDTAAFGPLVHVSCMSEDSIRALGLACDVKLEKDV